MNDVQTKPTAPAPAAPQVATPGAPQAAATSYNEARLAIAVDVWKKTIDEQMHFNDLEMRIRNYAITILAAIIGAAGLAFKDKQIIRLFGFRPTTVSLIIFAGLIIWLAFYFMDRFWYHPLLKASVAHAEAIEAQIGGQLPEIGLSRDVSNYKPLVVFGREIHSEKKIDIFYLSIAALLLVTFVGIE